LNDLSSSEKIHVKRSIRLLLKESLGSEELSAVCNSYDVVGDIAIIRVPQILVAKKGVIADAIMQVHNNVETVLMQTSAVSGDFRTRRLEWVSGENKTLTVHREFGCVFEVDLARCYFSPRLSFERKRIAGLVQPNEVVVNMFAGIGCFSIVMARHSKVCKVFSADLNPWAVELMQKNVRLNRVQGKVILLHGDSGVLVKERLSHVADRVLMPLPEKAYEYLGYALLALKPSGGWIHYYDFVHAAKGEEPVEKVEAKMAAKLSGLGVQYNIQYGRVVRATGPRWFQVVLDIFID
jgi:tRNA (guanine37-N1)-methyltransferase